jgi:hypothetical protein
MNYARSYQFSMLTNSVLPASSLLIERHLEFLASLPTAPQPVPGAGWPLPKAPQGKPFRPWLGTDFSYTVVAR